MLQPAKKSEKSNVCQSMSAIIFKAANINVNFRRGIFLKDSPLIMALSGKKSAC
jgi:hypothetical protein